MPPPIGRRPCITARIIAWEGGFSGHVNQQQMVKEYTAHLKECITEEVQGTGWRYQRFKTCKSSSEGIFMLELYLVHSDAPESPTSTERLLLLSEKLLSPRLAAHLRSLNPGAGFFFAPSREGDQTVTDRTFMRCFSAGIVSQYCISTKLSKELEAERDGFLTRNSTRFIHTVMVGMHDAASMVARCENQIEQLTQQVERFNGVAFNRGVVRAGAAVYERVSGDDRASLEAAAQLIRIGIANACHLVRAVKRFAPDVKKALEPQILTLHARVIQARLALASDAYLRESVRGIEILKLLEKIEKPTSGDFAIAINAFGNLMQTTMPLFRATLAVTDDELKEILPTLAIAGVTAATAIGAGGLVYFGVASLFGPAGIIAAAAGAAGLAFGSKGAKKGAEWMDSQQNNPSVVLLDVQKTLEECAAYLIGLLVISTEAEGGDDVVFLERVQHLRSQVSSGLVLTPEYVKAYFRQVTKKLEEDMGLLKVRLEKYSAKLAAKQLKDHSLSLPGIDEQRVCAHD